MCQWHNSILVQEPALNQNRRGGILGRHLEKETKIPGISLGGAAEKIV
jgi:hypothetical protein